MGTETRVREEPNKDELLADEWLMLLGGGIIQKKFGLEPASAIGIACGALLCCRPVGRQPPFPLRRLQCGICPRRRTKMLWFKRKKTQNMPDTKKAVQRSVQVV